MFAFLDSSSLRQNRTNLRCSLFFLYRRFRLSNPEQFMALPQVSIIGRPNVGKSSIFNWLAGRRLAIVDDMAGVTRDRMTFMLEEGERYFEIVDTGGIGINDVDHLDEEIEAQIEIGIQGADLLMFVVDVRDGKVALDEKVTRRLRGLDKPVLIVANKCDGDNWELEANDFFSLNLSASKTPKT